MKTIRDDTKYVWVRGEKYLIIPGSVNQEKRYLNAVCGD